MVVAEVAPGEEGEGGVEEAGVVEGVPVAGGADGEEGAMEVGTGAGDQGRMQNSRRAK